MSDPTPSPAPPADAPDAGSPFHAGEQAVQERAGVRAKSEQIGRKFIRDFMPDEHRELFGALPWLLLGSLDARDRPWASILVGPPGFLHSPDPRTLEVRARLGRDDPAGELSVGAPVGLLGLQLETRRRNRMNGTVIEVNEEGFVIRVGQSFGNCPQYIQARDASLVEAPAVRAAAAAVEAEGPILSARAAAWVRGADTFFIATASPDARGGDVREGVDVSHRGGKPGFVRVDEVRGHTVLTWPDFRGNNAFNTLGNLARNPRAGLTFVDFDTGDVLSLVGEAEAIWDGPERAAFVGAERLLRFCVLEGVSRTGAIPLRGSAPRPASQLAATGSWP